LGSLQNVTLLAPSNDALAALLNSSAAAALASDPGALVALLDYHVLAGTYYASSFTNQSQFIKTALTNTTYANITGGQVVEAKTVNGGVEIFTALKQNVTVTTAVSSYQLSLCSLQLWLTFEECQFHWRNHSHH
jgi:uncharacterized surface protein with fasciclin (FAS1) repeats